MQWDWNLGSGHQQGAAWIIELLVFNLSLFRSHGDRDSGNMKTQARVRWVEWGQQMTVLEQMEDIIL